MHEYIFDIYRQWRSKDNKSFFKKFFKLPTKTIIIFIISFLLLITALLLLIFSQKLGNTAIVAALLVEALYFIIINSHHKNFKLENSKLRYKNYIDYCNQFRKFLITNLKQINQNETYLPILKKAIDEKIAEKQKCYDEIFKNINDLFHVLLIPITVALIAGVSDRDMPIYDIVFISVMTALFIFTLYLTIWSIASFIGLIIKDEIIEYKQFSLDIGSIMDIRLVKPKRINLALL